MENYERKTLTTKRSFKYRYYVSPRDEPGNLPVLFFIHGFPDSAHLWKDVVAQLTDLPTKIVIPDTLGYGGTDKPTEVSCYVNKGQADDLAEIIHNELDGNRSAIIIGHDWGSALAQRTYLHHPNLFSGVVLLNVAYSPPSDKPLDLAALNAFTEKTYGYPRFAYWEFFSSPDAAETINHNLELMWEILHGDAEDWMQRMFCTRGAMRAYLTTNTERVPLRTYARDPKWKDEFIKQFQPDKFYGALQTAKAGLSNIHYEADKSIPKERFVIKVPVMFISCTEDVICRHDLIEIPKKAGLLPDLEEHSIESGHWVPMEQPGEVAKYIKNFVLKRFSE